MIIKQICVDLLYIYDRNMNICCIFHVFYDRAVSILRFWTIRTKQAV